MARDKMNGIIKAAAIAENKTTTAFLADTLRANGFSQTAVARKLGITKQAVNAALKTAGIELPRGEAMRIIEPTRKVGKSRIEKLALAAGVDRVDYLRSLLEAHGGNISATAATVGVSLSALWRICKKWGLTSTQQQAGG